MTGTRITDRDCRIVCMWLSGVKSEAMAAELGWSRGPLLRRVRDLGLPYRMSRSRSTRPPSLWPFIVEWAKRGHSARDIAIGIGCSKPDLVASIGCDTKQQDQIVSREAKPLTPRQLAVSRRASKNAWASRKRMAFARSQDNSDTARSASLASPTPHRAGAE